ncbi:MAG: ImmA/IrrE family metallo-endopeptidase [Anaerolineae bacterium]|jgi:HTH-type transcriptional regulator / antitoxin HigA|nr:ImmA/IrrE family metallo-endopeptidase [Anaerolineae bacterium]MBT7990428.1 ImmA/IrrE family metallo-endopeptidase [Anaerolineae bacterium]
MDNLIKNEYMPDVVSPPGETLLDILEVRGMTQAELSERTGRPKKTINEIIKGKAALTPATALQLERVLGTPASFWNDREQYYRENLARQAERKSLKGQVDWLNQFPIKKMVEFNWLPPADDPVEMLRHVISFFGIASPTQWSEIWQQPSVAFRKSSTFESDPFAVSTWIRRGEIEAQQIDCYPYDAVQFRSALESIRSLTVQLPENFQEETVRLCAGAGVAVVFVPQLPKARISGVTRWLTPNKAMIQVSLRYKTDDQLWFSFFHEAGHILKHGKRDIFIEGNGIEDKKEEEANHFASEFLIPATEYHRFTSRTTYYSKAEIAAFAENLGIAPGIVVGRLQHDKKIPMQNANGLKRRLAWVLN